MRPVSSSPSREIQQQQRENSFCKTYTKHKNHKQVVFHTQYKENKKQKWKMKRKHTPQILVEKVDTNCKVFSRVLPSVFLHFATVLCGIFSARLGVNLMEKYARQIKVLRCLFFVFSLRIYELLIVFKVIQFFLEGLANSANELRHCATTQWTSFHWESKIERGKGAVGLPA